MARFVAGAVFGLVVGVVGAAALGLHAQSADADVQSAAAEAGVSEIDLAGAVNTLGVDPRTYLRSVGELPPSPPASASPAVPARVACIVRVESHGDPGAVNPRTGAAGLGQFLRGTWLSTPQGRAGLSVFSADANRAAIEWMLAAGRAREFVAVSAGYC